MKLAKLIPTTDLIQITNDSSNNSLKSVMEIAELFCHKFI